LDTLQEQKLNDLKLRDLPMPRPNTSQLKLNLEIDILKAYRPELIKIAKTLALIVAKQSGRVSSPQILKMMPEVIQDENLKKALETDSNCFMGAVFRGNKNFVKIGRENSGSHKREVTVWGLKCS